MEKIRLSVIDLLGIDTADMRIRKLGQVAAWESDEVLVEARLDLKSYGEEDEINEELRFGTRCSLMNEKLHGQWGYIDDGKGTRYRTKTYKGTSYPDLFDEAEIYLKTEINKLIESIQIRKDRHESADPGILIV